MNELELIKITQYSFAILGKGLPKSCVLKGGKSENVVEFYKYDRDNLWNEYGRPVGFYFKGEHRYELRSKYDGHELIGFTGKELDNILNCL
tara:strand:- start:70 stop:342 length:273 start_codon:yes stop_codon:yes gene_type:complete